MSKDDETYQISCPKCGSFKVEDNSFSSCFMNVFHLLLIAMTYGVWLIVLLIWRAVKGTPIAKEGQEFKCNNCGYIFKLQ